MADTTKLTNTLGVGFEYIDSETQKAKTVYLKVPNPESGLSENDIKQAVGKFIEGDNPVFLNPQGEPFNSATAIVTAYTEEQEVIEVDIGLQ